MSSTRIPTSGRVSKPKQSRSAKPSVALEQAVNNEQNASPACPPRSKTSTRALDEAQEKELIEWIRRVNKLSHSPNAAHITASANQIFCSGVQNSTVSRAWVDKFIKGLPEDLKPSKARSSKKKRLEEDDIPILQEWFTHLGSTIAGVSPANIYNFDESIFQVGNGTRPVMVVTAYPDRLPDLPRQYCEWVTAIECLAADGWKSEPYIAMKEYLLEDFFEVDGLPDMAVLNATLTGRITDDAAYDWVQRFHKQTKERVGEGEKRVLLFRGEPHFLTFKFLRFCDENGLVPLCFPANMGHLMQPYGGNLAEPIKNWWKKETLSLSMYGMVDDPDDEKIRFLEGYFGEREKHLGPEAIVEAFAKQGISPLDVMKLAGPFQNL